MDGLRPRCARLGIQPGGCLVRALTLGRRRTVLTGARGFLAAAVVVACGYALAVPPFARAWVPGPVGQIAYVSDEFQPGDAGGPRRQGLGGFFPTDVGYHIWVINPDGSGQQELTHGDDDDPSWSPDGRQIAFTRLDAAGWRIWVMSNTGAGQRPLTPPGTPGGAAGGGGNVLPRFSPDGTRIAFVSRVFFPTWNFQVWVMDSDGGGLHQITHLPVDDIAALTWSPDSSHLLFWSTDIVHPTAETGDGTTNPTGPYHIYEMTSEGGALHQIAYDPRAPVFTYEGAQVGGLDWATAGLAVDVPVDGIHIASGVSDGSPPTPVTSGGGDMRGPTWSPDSARQPKLAFSFSPTTFSALSAAWGPSELYRTNPFEQITFDGFDHVDASWGPAVRGHLLYLRASASLVRAFEQGSSTIRVVLGCPASAGRRGCLDLLSAAAGSGARSVGKYKGRAGTSRVVVLHLSKRLRRSLGAGQKLLLTLHATVRGKATVVRQRAPVFAPASITGTCPVPTATVGQSVTVSGVLHTSTAGAHAAAASARTRVGMVAALNAGLSIPASAKIDRQGRFALTFTPTAPGEWMMQATWRGDRTHAPTPGRECGVLVSPPPPPPPVPTALAVRCQPGTAGTPVSIGGTLTPAVLGARVTLTYRRLGAPADTIVDSVSAASGSFADQPVPDAAGTWDAVANYAGDANHQASRSSTCQFTVATQPTVLTRSCPAGSSLGKVLAVSGSLTPAAIGASITLTYTHQTQGPLQTFTSTVSIDGAGSFSDASITATDAGEWDVTASFAGDETRSPASSSPCAIQVS